MADLDKHVVQLLDSHGDPKDGDKGCVTKCIGSKRSPKGHHGNYLVQGYDVISGDTSKRDIYDRDFTVAANKLRLPRRLLREQPLGSPRTLPPTRLPLNPRGRGNAWAFGHHQNYEKGYMPFNHNYHHMLPWGMLKQQLSMREVDLVQQSTYNINDGINLIILPEGEPYALALGLYTHPDDHPEYTEELGRVFADAKKIINPKRGHKVNNSNKGKFKTLFDKWEKKEFGKICKSGEKRTQKMLAASIAEYTPSSMSSVATSVAGMG